MKVLVLFLVFIGIAAVAQEPSNIQAETSGTCSPVVQSNRGKVQITCNAALDKATVAKVVSLLNKILQKTNDSDTTTKKLDDILEFLRTHTQNPYDQTVTYSFDGMTQRVVSQSEGRTSASFGGATADSFKKMGALESQRDWQGLMSLCQQDTETFPRWATPYLFCSEANIHMGNLTDAKTELEHAEDIVHNSADYARPIESLKKELANQPKSGAEGNK